MNMQRVRRQGLHKNPCRRYALYIVFFVVGVYLSLGCSVGAFLLYNFGLRKLSASTSISLMNLVPVFSIIFSATILNETISLRQIVGGVIVIIGVILSTTTKQREERENGNN